MAPTHALVSPRSHPSRLTEFVTIRLSDRERFFAEVADGDGLAHKVRYAFGTMIVLSTAHAAAVGALALTATQRPARGEDKGDAPVTPGAGAASPETDAISRARSLSGDAPRRGGAPTPAPARDAAADAGAERTP